MSAPADTPALSPSLLCLSCTLPFLHSLYNNNIGAQGASALAAVLKETKISNLEYAAAPKVLAFVSAPADRKANTFCAHRLDRNKLGPEGGAALAEGLKGNSTLQSLL